MAFAIVEVDPRLAEDVEQLGSKPKFWFSRENTRWLFKEARENTGEDWAEKVAAVLAPMMGTQAASVELAVSGARRGSISPYFLGPNEVLVHGNEILGGLVVGYQRDKRFRQSDHTVHNIHAALELAIPAEELPQLLREFASYLVLDALIVNTDRHHENWGLIATSDTGRLRLAPTFDHASSLGRELSDARKRSLLQSNEVAAYVERGKGGIYLASTDSRGANPLQLVLSLARQFPEIFAAAIRRAGSMDVNMVECCLGEIPSTRISDVSREFALNVIEYTLGRIKASIA